MSLASYVTFLRLFISPIFLLAYLYPATFSLSETTLPYALLVLMGLSELSDLFDGYLARKYNQVTDFGKIVDPMADSISHLTYLLAFTAPPVKLPVVLVFIIFYRDSVISTLRTLCALRGFALAARKSGKVKAFVQGIATLIVLLAMIPYSAHILDGEVLRNIAIFVMTVAALFAVGSAAEYLFVNRHVIKKLHRH